MEENIKTNKGNEYKGEYKANWALRRRTKKALQFVAVEMPASKV